MAPYSPPGSAGDPTIDVAALCVSGRSIYKKFPGVHCYDESRDARSFPGGMRVLGHPPCRSWSAFTAHQAKPLDGEKDLGLWVASQVVACGGVLEHPAHSRLWDRANLPRPGETRGHLWAVEVWQAWWGYPMRKATWLLFSHVPKSAIYYPMTLHPEGGDKRAEQVMSKAQRSRTTPEFAAWLIAAARAAKP